MNTFLVIIILIALSVESSNASKMFPKNQVHIKNSLGRNDDLLKIHCISDEDDLGIHFVRRTYLYTFKFGDKFFGGTKFDCTLSHGVGFKSSVTFTAYKQDADDFIIKFGKMTFWDAKDDGIYLTNADHNAKFMYRW
ncbi:PREDICTED: uncharacterized protein LOC109125619 [Camelina sativa]|uniref:S-protein homolog n=1 Tax=Camelina sativa TaxID=90675 RepID=A0ABM1Q8Q4_CAMSA|nr:PREDICTED: uncharacterized protein LOC109125619 [Camelina sativa]